MTGFVKDYVIQAENETGDVLFLYTDLRDRAIEMFRVMYNGDQWKNVSVRYLGSQFNQNTLDQLP